MRAGTLEFQFKRTLRTHSAMTVPDNDQSFLCTDAAPSAMDQYWAEGWRHFGIFTGESDLPFYL